MPLAKDVLRTGYQERTVSDRENADGFYAETNAGGELEHFGFYRQGEAVGWILQREPSGWMARRVSTRTLAASDEGEDRLQEMIDIVYRDAAAEHFVCSFCQKTCGGGDVDRRSGPAYLHLR